MVSGRRRACAAPRCPNTTAAGSYCDEHKAKYARPHAPVNPIYVSREWREFRKRFLRDHPVCVVCGGKADTCDHIEPWKGNLALFYDPGNIEGLCWRCHSRKTAIENAFGR